MVQIISVENQTAERAMQIANTTGSIESGVIMSLQAELLLEKLHNGICHFKFRKESTQEERECWATLAPNLISSKVKGVRRRNNPHCICFWDVEKGGFRSCLVKNILKIY